MAKMVISENRWFRRCLPLALVVMVLFLTGCPHNEYVVELKPQGTGIERKLVYFCADGTNKDTGLPIYSSLDTNEMAIIRTKYPAQNQTIEGNRLTVWATFTNALPDDVGGTGSYTNLTTTLGEVSFYVERFRGNDDLAGLAERRRAAADKLTDLVLGWSKMELGHERGYGQLRKFLDEDVRRDVRNFGEYFWQGQVINNYNTNAVEEFIVRFTQYLAERGYFTVGEMSSCFLDYSGDNNVRILLSRLQRLLARKLGVPDTEPVPASLAFLVDETSLNKSLDKYLATTKVYRAKYRQWEREKKLYPELKPPAPDDLADEALKGPFTFEFDFMGTPDHLAVKLSLPAAPTHDNGRWDEAKNQVVWQTDLMARTNALFAPFLFYASWAQADESFQQRHFGKVALTGDELTEYCLWRSGLDDSRAGEWEAFLSQLKPGKEMMKQLNQFRFSTESTSVTNGPSQYPRMLFETGLKL